jgi:predicted secreted protein
MSALPLKADLQKFIATVKSSTHGYEHHAWDRLGTPAMNASASLSRRGVYAAGGYSKNTGNASRLNANESIQARVAELQAQTASSNKITIESICQELAEATAVAKSKGQAQAMVSASALRAKLAGLMVERVEIGAPGVFDDCTSIAQVVDREFELLIEQFRPVDEADKQGLFEIHEQHFKEAAEFIAGIKARPIITQRVDSRNLKTPWQQHRPYSPQSRIGYRNNGTKPT